MKKLVFCAVAVAAAASATAQESVKSLYNGEPVAVTWENTLTIPAESFAEDVATGDFISISLADATDVLEIKGNGTWLPGSRLTRVDGAGEYRAYITGDMLAALRLYGLEICGASFTVTAVDIKNDGFVMPDGAIWGGYFWVDNWNTLELFKTAFDNYDGQRYLDIALEAGYDSYVLNVMTKWDDEAARWTKGDNTVKGADKATIDLKGIDVKAALADVNALLCQLNPEGGNPFNVTSVSLRHEKDVTGVAEIADVTGASDGNVYNLQGILVKTGVSSPAGLSDLPKAVYILNGRKIAN